MAKQGKGGDLRSQLGSFFRSTLQQLDSVREVVVQKSKAGRIQLDLTLLRRRRKAALAELGEVVAELAASGRIDEEDFPELSAALSRLEAVDEEIDTAERKARAASGGLPEEEEPTRWRTRGRERARDDDDLAADPDPELDEDDREEYDDDDGARDAAPARHVDDMDDVDDVDDDDAGAAAEPVTPASPKKSR